jgi:hypothetical protein
VLLISARILARGINRVNLDQPRTGREPLAQLLQLAAFLHQLVEQFAAFLLGARERRSSPLRT